MSRKTRKRPKSRSCSRIQIKTVKRVICHRDRDETKEAQGDKKQVQGGDQERGARPIHLQEITPALHKEDDLRLALKTRITKP